MLKGCVEYIYSELDFTFYESVELLLEYLLFAFKHPQNPVLRNQTDKQYQLIYNNLKHFIKLETLLLYPFDYFSMLFSEFNINQTNTSEIPMLTVKDSSLPTFKPVRKDNINTGYIALFLSNHCLKGHFTVTESIDLKASLVNFYLYAPWYVVPLSWIGGGGISQITDTIEKTA